MAYHLPMNPLHLVALGAWLFVLGMGSTRFVLFAGLGLVAIGGIWAAVSLLNKLLDA